MFIDQLLVDSLQSAIDEKNYEQDVEIIDWYKQQIDFYSSIILLTALLAFLVYLLFHGRR